MIGIVKPLFVLALVAAGGSICFGADLPRASPESQGIDSAALLAFLEAADKNIDAMHSIMLIRNGHVVAEGGGRRTTRKRPIRCFR